MTTGDADEFSLPPSMRPEANLDEEIAFELRKLRARREARRLDDADSFEPFEIISLDQELARPREPIKWTIQGLHAVGHNTTIAAAFKTGKSTLMASLCRALVDQVPFLGNHDVREISGKVAYLNLELTASDFLDYMRASGIRRLNRIIPVQARDRSLDIANDATFEWLSSELKRYDVEVIIVDPFSGAYNGEENSNSEVASFLKRLDEFKRVTGIPDLFMPVHMGRGGHDRARGATKLDDWADARWVYTKDGSGHRYLSGTVRGVGDLAERQTCIGPEGAVVYTGAVGGLVHHRRRNVRDAVLEYIEAHPGCSANDIEASVSGNSGEIRSARQALVSSNEVVVLSGARGAHRHFPFDHDTSSL